MKWKFLIFNVRLFSNKDIERKSRGSQGLKANVKIDICIERVQTCRRVIERCYVYIDAVTISKRFLNELS